MKILNTYIIGWNSYKTYNFNSFLIKEKHIYQNYYSNFSLSLINIFK